MRNGTATLSVIIDQSNHLARRAVTGLSLCQPIRLAAFRANSNDERSLRDARGSATRAPEALRKLHSRS